MTELDSTTRLLYDLAAGLDAGAPMGRDVFTIRDLSKEFDVSARARLAYVLAGKTVGFSLEEVREMLDLYDLGDGQVTQLKVALAKFAERIGRLERQKADIDRVVAELTRASGAMKAKLAARGIAVE